MKFKKFISNVKEEIDLYLWIFIPYFIGFVLAMLIIAAIIALVTFILWVMKMVWMKIGLL